MTYKASPRAYALLKEFEQGPKGGPALLPYKCPTGHWTIGWGHAGDDVRPGKPITVEEAEALLRADVAQFERDVNALLKVEASQGQFDALVCFAFNVGSDIDDDTLAEGLGDSTLLRKLNAGDVAAAAGEFEKWVNGMVAGRRIRLPGLVRRRAAERRLFLS